MGLRLYFAAVLAIIVACAYMVVLVMVLFVARGLVGDWWSIVALIGVMAFVTPLILILLTRIFDKFLD